MRDAAALSVKIIRFATTHLAIWACAVRDAEGVRPRGGRCGKERPAGQTMRAKAGFRCGFLYAPWGSSKPLLNIRFIGANQRRLTDSWATAASMSELRAGGA